MSTSQQVATPVDRLEQLVQSVEPAAFLVPPRLLRRVIKRHCEIGGLGLLVPHRKSHVIDRDTLLQYVTPDELGLPQGAELPPYVFLLVRPDADWLTDATRPRTLVKYWRHLFHIRIDHHMRQKLADGTLTPALVRQRLRRLGITEFNEISAVLRQEKHLLPPETPEAIYAEFVAVYLTLRRFDPALLPHFFPALRHRAAVDALVAEDIDAEAIYNATRLPGAPEPASLAGKITQADGLAGHAHDSMRLTPAPAVSESTYRALLARAEEMDARGNTVRAAILRTRAAEGGNLTLASARAELKRLSARLQKTLELSDADTETWRLALLPLLVWSARGSWSQEARFLYDLQSACVDSERGIYAVDLVGWALSLGKMPIKQQLPGHQAVAIVRHLRQAKRRMRYVRLGDAERRQLTHLLEHALEHRERLMRERFRPLLVNAMDEVGLQPQNVPERLGRDKLVEELLDRVIDYGHFNMGNLRDAMSRNQLKLPDLNGPVELFRGDPLIRLNRKLAAALDRVYRGGEIYMRMLHRVSSLAFGTAVGRFLMLFLILPFGLAFFTMVAPGLLVEEGRHLGHKVGLVERPLDLPLAATAGGPAALAAHHHRPLHMPNPWGWAACGLFFLLLFHVGSFRTTFFTGVTRVGRGLQTVFIHGPVWLFRQPLLQAILHNRIWVLFRRCVFWPALAATAAVGGAWQDDLEPASIIGLGAATFALCALLVNSRLGRDVEENLTDLLIRIWLWTSIEFIPGLLRTIMNLSRLCLEAVEQVLYTVDEWLRFRGGDSQASVAVKAVLGVFWFAITYVIRIYVNLLIEPTVNPIKHFPVVTVGHKVMIPFIRPVFDFLKAQLHFLGPIFGTGFAGLTMFFLPGICGFVVWELKENWKLYRANRARQLKPQMIGSHGETMLGLLRPGFHSGTVPKLYKRLRRAERHGQKRTVRKLLAGLHHVEESVEHFLERELLALLRQSQGWGGLTIALRHVYLATNRVAAELSCPSLGDRPLLLAFDHQNGWLLAGVLEVGWLPQLNVQQRQTLAAALAGLYKMAGVDLTREQLDESLPATKLAFDITDEGLVVWTGDGSHDAVYDLNEGPELQPHPLNGALPPGMPVLDTTRLLFANVPLTWQDWVRTWESGQGDGERRQLAMALLPAGRISVSRDPER